MDTTDACHARSRREEIRNPVSVNRQVSDSPTVNNQGGFHFLSITGAGSLIPAIIIIGTLGIVLYMTCKRCGRSQRRNMAQEARRVMRAEGDWIPSPSGSETSTPAPSPAPVQRHRRPVSLETSIPSRDLRFMDRPEPRTLPSPSPEPVRRHRGTRSCLLYTSPSPRDLSTSRMPSSA